MSGGGGPATVAPSCRTRGLVGDRLPLVLLAGLNSRLPHECTVDQAGLITGGHGRVLKAVGDLFQVAGQGIELLGVGAVVVLSVPAPLVEEAAGGVEVEHERL